MSIAILVFFLTEQALLIFAEGFHFFTHPLFLLDLTVRCWEIS